MSWRPQRERERGREAGQSRANPGACVSSVIGQFLTVMRLEVWTGRLGRRVGVANGEDRCWQRKRSEVELPFGSQIRSHTLSLSLLVCTRVRDQSSRDGMDGLQKTQKPRNQRRSPPQNHAEGDESSF